MNLVFNRATILFELIKRLIVEFSFLNFIFVKKFSSFPPKKNSILKDAKSLRFVSRSLLIETSKGRRGSLDEWLAGWLERRRRAKNVIKKKKKNRENNSKLTNVGLRKWRSRLCISLFVVETRVFVRNVILENPPPRTIRSRIARRNTTRQKKTERRESFLFEASTKRQDTSTVFSFLFLYDTCR